MRDELLDCEIYFTLEEAKTLIARWREEYNHFRPHCALGYRPPAPRAWFCCTAGQCTRSNITTGTYFGGWPICFNHILWSDVNTLYQGIREGKAGGIVGGRLRVQLGFCISYIGIEIITELLKDWTSCSLRTSWTVAGPWLTCSKCSRRA
jgi:hypothetical protein